MTASNIASLRAVGACRSDENKEEEQEEVPDTVLSDDDLDARIAALGLGTEEGVADKSTGEDPMESMQTMDRVRKQAGDIGMKAVGNVASAAINVLNTLEEPISEEDYAKMMVSAAPSVLHALPLRARCCSSSQPRTRSTRSRAEMSTHEP